MNPDEILAILCFFLLGPKYEFLGHKVIPGYIYKKIFYVELGGIGVMAWKLTTNQFIPKRI